MTGKETQRFLWVKWYWLPTWLKIFLILAGLGLLWFFGRKAFLYFKNLKNHSLLNSTVVTDSSGNTIDIGAKAAKIYDSFYNYAGGLFEDEETAIKTIKSVPKQFQKKLADKYFNLYTKDLKQDCIEYLEGDYDQVSYLVEL